MIARVWIRAQGVHAAGAEIVRGARGVWIALIEDIAVHEPGALDGDSVADVTAGPPATVRPPVESTAGIRLARRAHRLITVKRLAVLRLDAHESVFTSRTGGPATVDTGLALRRVEVPVVAVGGETHPFVTEIAGAVPIRDAGLVIVTARSAIEPPSVDASFIAAAGRVQLTVETRKRARPLGRPGSVRGARLGRRAGGGGVALIPASQVLCQLVDGPSQTCLPNAKVWDEIIYTGVARSAEPNIAPVVLPVGLRGWRPVGAAGCGGAVVDVALVFDAWF